MVEARPGRGTAEALRLFQRQAWTNLVFSVTRRCPLRCSHCVTSSAPDASLPVLDPALAERWAGELDGLARRGLRHVTFTGGEPILALGQVAVLARAARAAGLAVSVVSAGAWGRSDRQVERVLDALGDTVDSWDFGYDTFHAEHLPVAALIRAAGAAAARSAVTVRACDAGDEGSRTVIAQLQEALPGKVALVVQPVYSIGRGAGLEATSGAAEPGHLCMATGPFIREDGSTGPCCAALGYGARGRHPFDFGSARDDSLLTVWRRWRESALLRLVRMAGFTLPLRELAERELLADGSCGDRHICEICERLWDRDGKAAGALRKWAGQPALRRLLDELETELYGAVWTEDEPAAPDRPALDRAGPH